MIPSLSMPARERDRSPGKCIYCCRDDVKLGEEHIVPLSLNGTWAIDAAACKPCGDHTNEAYENAALQCDMVRAVRKFLELRRRRPNKKKPLVFPPKWPHGTASVAAPGPGQPTTDDDYPPLFNMLIIEPATKLLSSPSARDKIRLWIRLVENGKPSGIVISDEVTLSKSYDSEAQQVIACDYVYKGKKEGIRQLFATRAFGRMLARIAYCFAVAELKIDGFDGTEIRQLLRGERDDVFNFVGGSLNNERLTDRYLHYLAFRKRGDWQTVIVHLFSSYNAPAYEVVVGPAK